MAEGFIWCPYCGLPHRLELSVCPTTGGPLDRQIHVPPKKPSRHPLIGVVIDGRYRVRKRIGSGGMGEVFEADDLSAKRRVAIKVVSSAADDAVARFRFEAMAIASLYHPNICDVYDVGTMPNGVPYLVLERLKGVTLERHLRHQKRLEPPEALEIFDQVLSALALAHTSGILHRDLKPANVFLVARGALGQRVKLVDFGLAKDLDKDSNNKPDTSPGTLCGTLAYMSPEQLREEPMDARSDLFSVGVMLFEALTGRHPFIAPTSLQMAMKIVTEDPPTVRQLRPRLPPHLDAVVSRALAKDRRDRFESALQMQLALGASVEEWAEDSQSGVLPKLASPDEHPSNETTVH